MDDSEYIERKEKFYTVLGAFVFEFEQLCLTIKNTIALLFIKNGLQKDVLVDVLIHDSTADPLKRYLHALIFECYKDYFETNPNERKKLDLFFKKIQEAIQLRNDIVHSAWIIGFDTKKNNDNDIAIPIRYKASKNGLKDIYGEYFSKDLGDYWEQLKLLTISSRNINENIKNDRMPFNNIEIQKISDLQFELKK